MQTYSDKILNISNCSFLIMSEGIRAKIPEIIDAKRNFMEASLSLWNLRFEAAQGDEDKLFALLENDDDSRAGNGNCKGANCKPDCKNKPKLD